MGVTRTIGLSYALYALRHSREPTWPSLFIPTWRPIRPIQVCSNAQQKRLNLVVCVVSSRAGGPWNCL